MVTSPPYDNLSEEVTKALAIHYRKWVAKHPTDDIYAYVIYATSLLSRIGISVLTDQGLKSIAFLYKNLYGYKETIDDLERKLRWSVADTPYCGDYQEVFEHVNNRLESMMVYVDSIEVDEVSFSKHIRMLHSALVAALRNFRHTELHDTSRPMLYVDFGDMEESERLWFIEQCNDPEVVESYRSSL